MRRILALIVLSVLSASAIWLVRQQGAEERAIRQFVDEAQLAALDGLNRRNPNALEAYFATVEEGAQPSGMAETQKAYKEFVAQLPADSIVQFHSFTIDDIKVHEAANLARASYRLHFSVIRGSQAFFNAKATQNLALLKTPGGWRISGGDAAQLEEIAGTWPPR